MKLSTIFISAITLQLSAGAYSQNSLLKVDDSLITIEKVIEIIERQTSYKVFYKTDQVDVDMPVSLTSKEYTVTTLLEEALNGSNITYKMLSDVIVFAPRPLFQGTTVSGTIVDATTSEPLPGVNVLVEGTTRGTVTGIDGKYSIEVPVDNAILVFSYVGYISQKLSVNGNANLDVKLVADIHSLEEVVVIGYGERKRENLSGSIAAVGSEVISSRPATNAVSVIQGEIPGLVVQRSSGQPGVEGYELNVRGLSSTNGGNSPLVLIDGVAGNLDLLNPEDIENISVLKDASASIYGARAANGVFLVTTKKGKKGTPRISYSNNFAISRMSGIMESPNNYEFALMDNEANVNNGAAPMYTPDMLEKIRNNDPNPIPHPLYGGWMLFFTNTDWVDATFENGFQQTHNLNVSGGGDNSVYFLSGSYLNQQGIIKYAPDNNERYSLRLNYDYDFNKRIRLETKISLENQDRTDIGGIGSSWIITEAIFGMPNHPVYTKSGDKFFAQGGWGNAVAQAKEGETSHFISRNINTNFKLIIDVLNGLKLNFQSGINYGIANNKDIAKAVPLYNWEGTNIAYYTIANPSESSVTQLSSNTNYRNFTGYFQYAKTFAGKHDIEIMGGASYEVNDYDWFNAGRDNFVSDQVWSINLGGTGNMRNDGGGEHWGIGSFFSRLSYVFNSRYIVEANFRYDGSSRFQEDTRWGFFPGVSVGWRLSEESFIKDLNFFDNMKLRASYGETGNQEGIGLYDYLQLINIGGVYPFGPGLQVQSASLAGMVSLDRTWETLQTQNIGVDVSILSSRLDFSFDYFVKNNKDLLIPVTYPSLLGATAPYSNSGKLKTWGFETSLGWKQTKGDFQYSARVILSDAQNKVEDYGGADTYNLGLNQIREGYPVNTYFAYQFDGIIKTEGELMEYKKLEGVPSDIGIGDARFKDINGDGKISPYSDVPGEDGDVVNAGNTSPRFNYGVNLSGKYKGFDVSLFIQGVGKRTLFREGEYAMPWSDWWRQPPRFYYGNTWSTDRPDAEYPRLSHGSIRYWNYQSSTLQKINAAYARLKNLQIGYSFPATTLSKLHISSLRIYLSGENLLEKHDVKGGWDPESSASGFNYPFQRMYSAGLNITF